MRVAAAVFVCLALAGCKSTEEQPDSGNPMDAGGQQDAQPVEDALVDSGPASDAAPADTDPADVAGADDGGPVDAMPPVDAGDPMDASPGDDAGSPPDAGQVADMGPPDMGPMVCPPPADLSRAELWTRSNPMFISGLVPGMGVPTAAEVGVYFDQFNASATHLWMDGLPVITSGWAAANHPRNSFVSWTEPDGTMVGSNQVLGGHPANAAGRIGYQIGDEPVTMAELSAILSGAQAIRTADPAALTIVNFTVTRATDINAQLAATGADANVDVLAYDLYTYTQNAYGALALIRNAARASGKSYWRYLRSYHDPGDADRPSATDMRWDAFSGLVFGYTGHTWFLYQVGPPHSVGLNTDLFDVQNNYSATPNAFFAIAAGLNQQMAVIGRSLAMLRSTDVRYVPSGALLQPDGTTNWSAGAGNDPFITAVSADNNLHEFLMGFFSDDCGDGYVMIQNPMHTGGQFPSLLDRNETVRLEFDFSSVVDPAFDTSVLEVLNKDTGAIETQALTPLSATTAFVEFVIQPGDVVFYKYRTGRPFAQRP